MNHFGNINNPYQKYYRSQFPEINNKITQEQVYKLVFNLGHVHNLLGIMISDIVKTFGNIYINKFNQSSINKQVNNENLYRRDKKRNSKQKRQKVFKKSYFQKKQNYTEKMQIQQPQFKNSKYQKNENKNTYNNQKSQFLNNQIQQYEYKQKDKINKINKKNISLTQIFESHQKKQNNFPQISDFNFELNINFNPQQLNQRQNARLGNDLQNKDWQVLKIPNQKNINQKDLGKIYRENYQQNQNKTPFNFLFDNSQTLSNEQIQQSQLNKIPQKQQIQINKNHKSKKQYIQNKSDIPKKDYIYTQTFINQNKNSFLDDTFYLNQNEKNTKFYQKQSIKSNKEKIFNIKSNQDQYITSRPFNMRKKKQRQNLKGSECPDCKAFYEAIKTQIPDADKLCECSSRHRSNTTFMAKNKVENYSQALSLD